jgi:hypothetical protein
VEVAVDMVSVVVDERSEVEMVDLAGAGVEMI